ncbi:MAG: Ig-like domain-containing protein [Ignavibacteriales bacterium]|nr:Ig-like domain-containing protein [Ignavibacteriales bacterium]
MNKMKNYFKVWLIPLLLVIIMASCDNRDGITFPPVVTTPTVSSTNPINAATDVAFNNKITATFSEAMDSLTITTASFTLMQGTSFVSGTVSYTGTTATFAPSSNLAPNTIYIATITTTAKNLGGSALAKNYVWNFTTGAAAVVTPPTVNSTDPVNAATGVPINQKIAATFSVAMDATTITASTFTLLQGTTPVSGFVSYTGTTTIFAPASNLAPNTAYTVTITTGAKDLAGIALVNNYVWSFTTGATVVITPPTISFTDPANAATGVAFNQKIAATFSKTMDASTITNAVFTLMQGTTPVSGFVSYSGTTAILAPASNLLPNTEYTVTITTGAKDLAGIALANNYIWKFTTGAAAVITPPTVSFTDPANVATGVPFNQKVAATFSKTMDASTITTATFTLMQGTTFVSGTVSYIGITATYIPSTNLAPNTTYTATITTGAKDLAGNALVNNYVWSFTTGAGAVITPPTVSFTDPANAATGVPLNQKIAATFSKTMDASTIQTSTYSLMQGTTPVSGFVSYTGTTATFAPASNLLPNTEYTATITTGAKDLAGTPLVNNYVWKFTTGAAVVITPPTVSSTDPVNAAISVPLNQKIAATFSKTMDASTISTATFTLMQGTTPVSGFVSYSGITATFAPASNLLPSTIYTATITTGAKDLAGTALVNNYVWSFTTGAGVVITPPTVSSTDPVNAATGVGLNKQIAATFSKTMDASTISTATFTLMQGTTPVSGFVSYSGITATFAPASNLLPNTIYTATITTGAKDLAGTALVNNYVWSFTTVIPYSITLSSNPSEGGTTNGGGTYNPGSSVTVTATPNPGYTFTNWTENGMEVSTNANYQFNISGNRTLIANFSAILLQYTVTLSSNPSAGGTTNGGGTFNSGSLVTVNATPNPGYTFTNWTENGMEVSTNANYQFNISGNRTLIANFTAGGPTIDLGAAETFGGFGGTAGLTNQGIFTVVNGDIGSTAASTLITGFHDTGGNVFTETPLNIGTVNGTINCAPPAPGTAEKFAIAQQALADATSTFNYLAGLPGGPDPGAGELGGLVLAPGTYTAAAGTFKITSGDLTLDAQGNPNAVWVFQMAASLTVGQAGQARSIILVGGAQAKNIYWQVGSAATINGAGGGTMEGTIISYSGVTFSTAGNVILTTLNGRALSLIGSVTMVNTIINIP